MSEVSTLLMRSREAHGRAKLLERDGHDATATWAEAEAARLAAHGADPAHDDLSWLEDALHRAMPGETERRYHRMAGRTPAEVALLRHADLLAFYGTKRTGAGVLDLAPTERAAERVQAPPGVAVEDTEAFRQLKREGVE